MKIKTKYIVFIFAGLILVSCKKEVVYKGTYKFKMDIGYMYDGAYFPYDGPAADSFNLLLREVNKESLIFEYHAPNSNPSDAQKVSLLIDKKDNIAGAWSIYGVGGKYRLSGKITGFHEQGKIEGTVSIAAYHDVPPLNLELETSVTAFGPFVLEKIE